MKSKKTKPQKIFSIFLFLCLLISAFPSQPVFADLIVTPSDLSDSFYIRHSDTCVLENNTYMANGADGYITIYESPISDNKNAVVLNGTYLSTVCSYSSSTSIDWVYVSSVYSESNDSILTYGSASCKGWIKLSDCISDDLGNTDPVFIADHLPGASPDPIGITVILMIALASLSVTAITAVLIYLIFKKKYKKEAENEQEQ